MSKKKPPAKKSCKECKCRFRPPSYAPFQVVCTPACAFTYLEKQKVKNRRKAEIKAEQRAKVGRKKTREGLEKLKTLPKYKNELQPIINQIARLLDKGLGCVSCGRGECGCETSVQFAGGHYKAVGGNDIVRFNLHNVHRQCNKHCNDSLSGAPVEYLEGIAKEYGKKYAEYLSGEIRAAYNDLHMNREQIKEAKKTASAIRNKLVKENKTYSTEERLKLRQSFNIKIGIYL